MGQRKDDLKQPRQVDVGGVRMREGEQILRRTRPLPRTSSPRRRLKNTSVSSIGTRQRPATKSSSSTITRGHHAQAGRRRNRLSSAKLRARQDSAER